jgi:hypothetical protein
VSFASVPFAIITLVLFSRLLQFFGVEQTERVLLIAGLGVGTLCWRYAGSDFSEAMQMGLLLLAVYGAMRGTAAAVFAAGCGFAGLIVVKLVHLALLPLFLGYIAAQPGERRQRIGRAMLHAAPVFAGLGLLAWLNVLRFGNPFESGYGAEAHLFSPAQLVETVPKLLWSLDKGMFVFSPVLVLGLLGWPEFFARHRREALLCAGIILIELALAGAWYSWYGGWSWGPRLLVPTIPLWLLPAAFWLTGSQGGRRSLMRFRIAVFIVVLSAIAQVPGVLIRDQQIHHIKLNMLTPEEQAGAPSDFLAAPALLRHKLTQPREVYRLSELGIPGDRALDLTPLATFQGVDVWTEHLARTYHTPLLRWLPLAALLVVVALPMMSRKTVRRNSIFD